MNPIKINAGSFRPAGATVAAIKQRSSRGYVSSTRCPQVVREMNATCLAEPENRGSVYWLLGTCHLAVSAMPCTDEKLITVTDHHVPPRPGIGRHRSKI